MLNSFRIAAAAIGLIVALSGSAMADDRGVSPTARRVAEVLDYMQVESHWPAGVHVNWRSGEPDGLEVSAQGRHTHCSAFVAAAAAKLGVYILRPPAHPQTLLANAQNEWLADEGRERGWRALPNALEAQRAANQGELVVASYRSHRDDKPGHIAIVRPGEKSAALIEAEGPNVIQAGTVNRASVPLATGFAGHPHAWGDHEVAFYAHEVKLR